MSTAIHRSSVRLVRSYEAVSDSDRTLREISQRDRYSAGGSASDWAPILGAALIDIRNTCSEDGWDGPDSIGINDDTIDLAAKVAECLFVMLHRGTPAPDLVPESDGEVSINWSTGADRVFSISIGSHRRINYAGQFGSEGAVHAWQPIDARNRASLEASLQDVARYVGRLFPPLFAVRRAA